MSSSVAGSRRHSPDAARRRPGRATGARQVARALLVALAGCADRSDPAAPAAPSPAVAVPPRTADAAPAATGPTHAAPIPTGETGSATVRILRGDAASDFTARGPVLRGFIGRKGSGGYTDARGRVVTYRDSVALPSTQLAAAADGSGEGISLNVVGQPVRPGRYAVVPSAIVPPWDFTRAFDISHHVGGCNHVYRAESGTLTVVASAGGRLELTFDATLQAVPLFVFDPAVGFTCRGGASPAVARVRATGRIVIPAG